VAKEGSCHIAQFFAFVHMDDKRPSLLTPSVRKITWVYFLSFLRCIRANENYSTSVIAF
jgi:hypothetical protein